MMLSAGRPSSVAMICAYVVSWPWPCDLVPRRQIPVPVGWMRISAESNMAMPRMSQARDGPAPTISVKNATPMPMSSLVAQLPVADGVHRLLQGDVVVAGIVLPPERRRVGELLAADQVLHAQFGRI